MIAVFNTHNNTLTFRTREGDCTHIEFLSEDENIIELKDKHNKAIGYEIWNVDMIVATHDKDAPTMKTGTNK